MEYTYYTFSDIKVSNARTWPIEIECCLNVCHTIDDPDNPGSGWLRVRDTTIISPNLVLVDEKSIDGNIRFRIFTVQAKIRGEKSRMKSAQKFSIEMPEKEERVEQMEKYDELVIEHTETLNELADLIAELEEM